MRYVFGSSGHAREIDWLIDQVYDPNQEKQETRCFVSYEDIGGILNGKKIISEDFFLELIKNNHSEVFLGIGKPNVRAKIIEMLSEYDNLTFPNLIHPSVISDTWGSRNFIGVGNVICAGAVLTTNITLGSFVHINVNVTVGHDSQIGDFSIVSPGCNIAGKVQIGEKVFVGAGAVIIENINICSNVIIGAGAVVTKKIDSPGTYVGVPAKKIENQK